MQCPTGNSGDINIQTGSLYMTEGAHVTASTFGKGDAGSVTINANDLVKFDGEDKDGSNSMALSQVVEGAGKAGGVSITTASLEVLNGAQLGAGTFGKGDAGSVTIEANDLVKFDGGVAFSVVGPGGKGKAGGVSITTASLKVLNDATLTASTFGEGDAASVTIEANDLVKFDNSAALSRVNSEAKGKAGDVSITTGSLKGVA